MKRIAALSGFIHEIKTWYYAYINWGKWGRVRETFESQCGLCSLKVSVEGKGVKIQSILTPAGMEGQRLISLHSSIRWLNAQRPQLYIYIYIVIAAFVH